jgi:hypothetical protein
MMESFKRAIEEAGLEAVPNTMRQTPITQLVYADLNFPTVQRTVIIKILRWLQNKPIRMARISKRRRKN